jgi:hypothetical protein
MSPRFALINKSRDSAEQVGRYLPANYYLAQDTPDGYLVAGSDNAGWTMDGYVLPRLLSGLIGGHEITQDKATELGFTPEPRVVSNEEGLFWSNDQGWVDLASATVFGRHEVPGLNLPLSAMSQWVDMDQARKIESQRLQQEIG